MSQSDDTLVEVVCQFRCVRDKTIAIWDGYKTDAQGKEEWTWLPRGKIKWDHRTDDRLGRVVVTMPEWMARDRQLAWREIRTMDDWIEKNRGRAIAREALEREWKST